MVKATVVTDNIYSLTISGLTKNQIHILRGFMQNSPNGHSPNNEPEEEWKLREAIHDACLEVINK